MSAWMGVSLPYGKGSRWLYWGWANKVVHISHRKAPFTWLQRAVAGWKMDSALPVAISPCGVPRHDRLRIWDSGLLPHRCPLWLCRKDCTHWDNDSISPHYTQKCISISYISVFFQTQPVGLTLHGHVGLHSEQTQLPELQLIRRCFQWVREELQPNCDLQPEFKSTPPVTAQVCFLPCADIY